MQLKLKIKKFNKYRDKTGGLIPFYLKKHFENLRIPISSTLKNDIKETLRLLAHLHQTKS